LCLGPLARLNPVFLPLLYNRRHAGVTLFLLALLHAVMVITPYHAGGDMNPFLSIFASSPLTNSVGGVPFQVFGFFALVILALMAATSHDFWLANWSAPACLFHFYLVAPFKHGLERKRFSALDGQTVSLQVTLIFSRRPDDGRGRA
jgi:hypothetical protein